MSEWRSNPIERGNYKVGLQLEWGTLLGLITETNEYALYNPKAKDGTEQAAAIAPHPVNSNYCFEHSIVKRPAEIYRRMLIW